MAIRSVAQLKAWFKHGKYPTEEQFGDWLDSYFHKEEDKIPVEQVEGLPEQLNGKYPASAGLELTRRQEQLKRDFDEHQEYSENLFKEVTDDIETLEDQYDLLKSEYKFDRYVTNESFDMNGWTESGGICACVCEANGETPAIEGTNIPEGFTDFYGYVLKNTGGGNDETYCSIQVVTDSILKKTMIRSSYPVDKGIEWTPWTEIGGNGGGGEETFVFELPDRSPDGFLTDAQSDLAVKLTKYAKLTMEDKAPKSVFIKVDDYVFPTQIETRYYGENLQVYLSFSGFVDYNEPAWGSTTIHIDTNNFEFQSGGYEFHKTDSYVKRDDVHVVTAYPTDLSSYPDGSIFIMNTPTPTITVPETTTPTPTTTPEPTETTTPEVTVTPETTTTNP